MPCRKGMTGCARSCLHRKFVAEYSSARTAGEEARDAAVGTFGPGTTEWESYVPPPILFRDWLISMAGWSGR
jgi:hypothetical protein